MSRKIAIIGTAGRDKQHLMNTSHWEYMCQRVANELEPTDHLISGGAAWADHVVVWAYINKLCSNLTLHLPAPFNGQFFGGKGTSGGASNYYHHLFSKTIDQDSLQQIYNVLESGVNYTTQPEANGYTAMFARNALVANECTHMIAFTFGAGNVPNDAGTKSTWNMAGTTKMRAHISLLN